MSSTVPWCSSVTSTSFPLGKYKKNEHLLVFNGNHKADLTLLSLCPSAHIFMTLLWSEKLNLWSVGFGLDYSQTLGPLPGIHEISSISCAWLRSDPSQPLSLLITLTLKLMICASCWDSFCLFWSCKWRDFGETFKLVTKLWKRYPLWRISIMSAASYPGRDRRTVCPNVASSHRNVCAHVRQSDSVSCFVSFLQRASLE